MGERPGVVGLGEERVELEVGGGGIGCSGCFEREEEAVLD